MMGQRGIVEKVYKQKIFSLVVVDKTGVYVWIREIIDGHGVIIYLDVRMFIDFEFFFVDIFFISSIFSKGSESELSIIEISHCEIITSRILHNLLHFNV